MAIEIDNLKPDGYAAAWHGGRTQIAAARLWRNRVKLL
jgi:hypothetical protein